MTQYTIYPKDGGDEFQAEFYDFQIIDDRIALRNSSGKESERGHLALDKVAAIVPQQDLNSASTDIESLDSLFFIYLKGRKDRITILAGAFDPKHPDRVPFYNLLSDGRMTVRQPHPRSDIYVAKSEVVGIFPSTGLDRKWRVE